MLLRALHLPLRPQPFVPGPHLLADEQPLAVHATFRVPRVVRLAPGAAQERLLAVVHLQGHSRGRAAEPRRGRDLVVRRLVRAPRAFELEEARQPAISRPPPAAAPRTRAASGSSPIRAAARSPRPWWRRAETPPPPPSIRVRAAVRSARRRRSRGRRSPPARSPIRRTLRRRWRARPDRTPPDLAPAGRCGCGRSPAAPPNWAGR